MYNLMLGLVLLAFSGEIVAKDVVDAAKLLEEVERIRNPSEDYSTFVYLEDKLKGKTTKNKYETYCKGSGKALVKFLEPAADVGTRVLFVENDMWVYIPSSAKPMRVSPQQKLAGNAAYGDVTRLNFVGNYTAKFLREDKFDQKAVYVLDLTSIEGRPVTYDRIEYWIDKVNKRPIRLIFKTMTEKVIREGTYRDYEKVFGVERPSTYVITDALDNTHVTTLRFKETKKRKFADVIFQKQNLGRD